MAILIVDIFKSCQQLNHLTSAIFEHVLINKGCFTNLNSLHPSRKLTPQAKHFHQETFTATISYSSTMHPRDIILLCLSLLVRPYKARRLLLRGLILGLALFPGSSANGDVKAVSSGDDFLFRHRGYTTQSLVYAQVRFNLDVVSIQKVAESLLLEIDDKITEYSDSQAKYKSKTGKNFKSNARFRLGAIKERTQEIVEKINFLASLRESIYSTEELQSVKGFNRDGRRSKRFVAVLLLGIILGGAAFSLLGMYKQQELQGVKEDLMDTDNTVKLISHKTVDNTRAVIAIGETDRDLIRQSEATALMGQARDMALSMNLKLARLERTVTEVGSIIASMAQGKASPLLIIKTNVSEIEQQLKITAEETGHVLLIQHRIHLAQCESSFLASDTGFDIFIHVPMAKPEDSFNVYEFLRTPIALHSGLSIHIESSKAILAVNSERGYDVVQSMTLAELGQCRMLSDLFLCDFNNVARRARASAQGTDEEVCLYSLFRHNFEGIKTTCRWRISRLEDRVFQVSPHTFFAYTNEPTTGVIRCDQSRRTTDKTFLTKGSSRITVPANCSGILGDTTFSPRDQYLIREHEVRWAWPFPKEDLLGNLQASQLDTLEQSLESRLRNASSFSLEEAQEELGRLETASNGLHVHQLATWASGGTSLVVVLLIGGLVILLVWRKCCSSTTNHPVVINAPPSEFALSARAAEYAKSLGGERHRGPPPY